MTGSKKRGRNGQMMRRRPSHARVRAVVSVMALLVGLSGQARAQAPVEPPPLPPAPLPVPPPAPAPSTSAPAQPPGPPVQPAAPAPAQPPGPPPHQVPAGAGTPASAASSGSVASPRSAVLAPGVATPGSAVSPGGAVLAPGAATPGSAVLAPGAAPAPDEGELFGPLPSREVTQVKAQASNPRWRRLAFGVTAGAAGLALIGGLSLKVVESQKYREFNAFEQPDPEGDGPPERCSVDQPNRGPAGCAGTLAEGQRAGRWGNVGFVLAGAFAATAVVLKLTTPAESSPATVACAPGLAAATCRLTF
jgi:hypothetical protein